MKIGYKFSIPLIIILVLSFCTISGLSYYYSTAMVNHNMEQLTESQVDEVSLILENTKEDFNALKAEINTQNISKAKTFALMISQNPQILDSLDTLNHIAKTLDVEELHVCDENGVLRWGNFPEFFGFDFSTTEQTKPFITAINNKSFELAQEPSERGSDKALFQYIGVARQDAPGIVQVGVQPSRLAKALERSDIKAIAQSIVFGKEGYIFIFDKNSGQVVSHKDISYVGRNIKEFDFSSKYNNDESGSFKYTYSDSEKFLSYKTYGDYVVCATIPTEEFTGGLDDFLRSIAITAVLALILVILLVQLIIRFNITGELSKALRVLRCVEAGDLSQKVNTASSKEFKELGSGINSMILSLRNLITNSITSTQKLDDASKKLVTSADHTSRGAEEIATTVNELAQGANEQAENATRGAMLAKDALIQLQEIEAEVKDTLQLTDETKKTVEKGISTVRYQSEKMQHNVESAQTVDMAVKDLSNKATEISQIINVITGIADQTNMLALNAAIEAARAGEAGKGFAVVADEVRKLAENSTLSAQQISRIINEIQAGVENVKQQAGASISAVEEQKLSVQQTQLAFEEISNAAVSTLDQVNRIYNATNAIVKAVHGMVDITEGAAAASQQSAAGTEEISASTQEQSAALEEITHIADALTEMVKELSEITSKFLL